MNKLTRNEAVAVFAGVGMIAYLFFGPSIMSMLNPQPMNNPTSAEIPQTGFTAEDVTVGTGDIAEPGDIVSANYVGTLSNGRVFDSSYDRGQPIQFTLGAGQVIKGWDQGIQGMRVGGKRILRIAPDYGYGSSAAGPIPANSPLIFQVELVKVEKPSSAR